MHTSPDTSGMTRVWRLPYRAAGQQLGFVEHWQHASDSGCGFQALAGRSWFIIETPDGNRRETGNTKAMAYRMLREASHDTAGSV